MTYSDKYGTFFGRRDGRGNVAVLHTDDGSAATRLDASVYPLVVSMDAEGNDTATEGDVSARYEHPEGIVLTPGDAAMLGLVVED